MSAISRADAPLAEASGSLDDRLEAFLSDPALRVEPYAFLAELRERDPVHRMRNGAWIVTNYEGCLSLVREKGWTHINPAFAHASGADLGIARRMIRTMLLFRDPPEHTRLRKLLGRVFLRSAAEAKRPVFREHIEHLLSEHAPRGGADFTRDIARHVPIHMICELLGLPQERYDDLVRWSFAYASMLAVDVTPEMEAEADRSFAEFTDYLAPILERLAAEPRECLLSEWLAAEQAGELRREELVGYALFTLTGGHVTTTYTMGNAVYCMLRHPDQWELLKRQPELVAKAVEEVLRYESASRGLVARWATEDLELCGKRIRKGELAYGITAAADRDPAFFPDPDRFDIRRERNFHLAFGGGPHVCVGQFVARVEIQEMLLALSQRLPDIELDGPPKVDPQWIVRGFESLRLKWTPRPSWM